MRTRLKLEPNVSVMKCAKNKTVRAHDARSQWMYLWVCSICSATQAVKCGVASSSPSSLASVSLSFRSQLYNFTLPLCRPGSPVVILHQFIPLFSRRYFSHEFSLYSHCILGVVFTPPIGYSRPPSAVNDPTATKQLNSGKSSLEEVSQLFIYQVGTLTWWLSQELRVPVILVNSTKPKKSFVSNVSFVELLLLFL